jgi:hypothetical protein
MESIFYYRLTTALFMFPSVLDRCSVLLPAYFRSTAIFFFHIDQFITRLLFLSDFQSNLFNNFCLLNTRHFSRSFLPPWSDQTKNICWGKNLWVFFILKFVAAFSFFGYHCYKFTPRHRLVLHNLPIPYISYYVPSTLMFKYIDLTSILLVSA